MDTTTTNFTILSNIWTLSHSRYLKNLLRNMKKWQKTPSTKQPSLLFKLTNQPIHLGLVEQPPQTRTYIWLLKLQLRNQPTNRDREISNAKLSPNIWLMTWGGRVFDDHLMTKGIRLKGIGQRTAEINDQLICVGGSTDYTENWRLNTILISESPTLFPFPLPVSSHVKISCLVLCLSFYLHTRQ